MHGKEPGGFTQRLDELNEDDDIAGLLGELEDLRKVLDPALLDPARGPAEPLSGRHDTRS